MQGRHRDADLGNGPVDKPGKEGAASWDSSLVYVYTAVCETDSRGNLLYQHRELPAQHSGGDLGGRLGIEDGDISPFIYE